MENLILSRSQKYDFGIHSKESFERPDEAKVAAIFFGPWLTLSNHAGGN
jgi:hypothetical protein